MLFALLVWVIYFICKFFPIYTNYYPLWNTLCYTNIIYLELAQYMYVMFCEIVNPKDKSNCSDYFVCWKLGPLWVFAFINRFVTFLLVVPKSMNKKSSKTCHIRIGIYLQQGRNPNHCDKLRNAQNSLNLGTGNR